MDTGKSVEKRPDFHLRVGIDWVSAEVTSEPYVVMSFRGYAPVVDVVSNGEKKMLFISSKSISLGLDPFVQANGGKFLGMKIRLRKEADSKMAPYLVEGWV